MGNKPPLPPPPLDQHQSKQSQVIINLEDEKKCHKLVDEEEEEEEEDEEENDDKDLWKLLNQRLEPVVQSDNQSLAISPSTTSPANDPHHEAHKKPINGFLTPTGKRILIKLNYTLHYVCDLPSDCHNVHVQHKLFVRNHVRWNYHFKRYHEIGGEENYSSSRDMMSTTTTHLKLNCSANCNEVKRFNLLQHHEVNSNLMPDRLLKVDHMTHDHAVKSSSSLLLSSSAAAEVEEKEEEKRNTLRCRQIGDSNLLVNNDLLLHQSSTVTSKRNELNCCFHLNCAEQLILELTKIDKTKQGAGGGGLCDDSHVNQINDEHGDNKHQAIDVKIKQQVAIQQQVAAAAANAINNNNNNNNQMIDEKQPSISRRVDFSLLSLDKDDDDDDDNLEPDFHTQSVATEGAEKIMMTSKKTNSCITRNGKHINVSGKKTIHKEEEEEEIGDGMGKSSKGYGFSLNKKTTRLQSTIQYNQSKIFRDDNMSTSCHKQHDDDGDDNHDDDDIIFVLVFEIYSRDFYGDKLQGWSCVDVPVDISRKLSSSSSLITSDSNNNISNSRSSNGATSLIKGNHDNSTNKGTCNKYNRTRRVQLPVIRPTFNHKLIDRVRYYLTGRLSPIHTPSLESFVNSTNRYMMQSEQNGKLVLDYEVTRQFSDVKLDEALRELVRSGSMK